MTKIDKITLSEAQKIQIMSSEIVNFCDSLPGDSVLKIAACYSASIIFQQASACEVLRGYEL